MEGNNPGGLMAGTESVLDTRKKEKQGMNVKTIASIPTV